MDKQTEIIDGRVETYIVTFDGVTGERGINYQRISTVASYEHISESKMLEIAEASTEDLTTSDLVELAR